MANLKFKKKPLIGVDVDSILADTMTPMVGFYNQRYSTKHKLKDYNKYDWTAIWQCDEKTVWKRIFEFYNSPLFPLVKPLKGAKKGINKLAKNYQLAIITSRPAIIKHHTKNWLDKHFFGKFSYIYHFENLVYNGSSFDQKAKTCQKLGIKLIIEDAWEFSYYCAESGISVILLDMPWNRNKKEHPKITRVFSWKEIVTQINFMVK